MVLFVSAVFLSYIPGVCLAQPADTMGIDKKETAPFPENSNAGQQKQINKDRDNTGINQRDTTPENMNDPDNTGIDKKDTTPGNMNADQQGQTNRDRDNTGINKRDTSPDKITADQQGQTKEERELTQKIRQAVMDDKALSAYAQNVKIITVDGMVTLRGPVRSEDEKRAIEEKAGQIAGKDKIKSEIEIAP